MHYYDICTKWIFDSLQTSTKNLYKLYINTILKENDKVLHKYLHLAHSFSKNFVKMFNDKNGNTTCE